MHIGIDLGGTKIEVIALNAASEELYRKRISTPQGDYLATLHAIQQLIDSAEQHCQQQGSVGIGIPGALSAASGLVKNANSTCLIGRSLDKDLADLLQKPVAIANDADCFTLSEATDGSAAAAKSVFGVIVGTGVGGGIVINGQLLSGPNAISGEWGHNPLPWQQEREESHSCYCGKKGCIETFLSGPGFAKHFNNPVVLVPPEIWKLAENGNPEAAQHCNTYIDQFARALAGVINILDPEVVVLGGGMSNIERLYQEVPERWGEYIFSDRVYTKLVKAQYGDSSGVRGAAWLGKETS